MRIAVNTRLLIADKLDGIGWFSHEVLKRIVRSSPEHEFLFLFDRTFDDQFIYADNVWAKVLFPQARHPLLYRMYFDYSIPIALKQWNADLFFSPDGFLSNRTRVPQIPVIHDINFEHRPEDLPKTYSSYYRSYFPQFAKNAQKIITVSEYSASDIASTYEVDREKIIVANNGVNAAYKPLSDEGKKDAQSLFADGSPYFIFVGNFSQRKNIHGIINAFSAYRKSGGSSKLILVGNPLWKYSEMSAALKECDFASDILFPGHLHMDELSSAVGGATAMIFPSYFEGFGIPILEAFAAGIPAIVGDNTSMPEVAGQGALFCDPDNHDQIAEQMRSLENDKDLVGRLMEGAALQLDKYNWDRAAEIVKAAIMKEVEATVES